MCIWIIKIPLKLEYYIEILHYYKHYIHETQKLKLFFQISQNLIDSITIINKENFFFYYFLLITATKLFQKSISSFVERSF